MADHRLPASFRQAPVAQQEKIGTGFTLHLPPTSRSPMSDLVEEESTDTDRAADDEITSPSSCKSTDKSQQCCPDCGQRTLRKCLIHDEFALVLCVDKSCGYPFAQTNIREYIVRVPTSEILEAARRRMLNAGVGEDTADKIVHASKLHDN
ncbi:hypothetical protein V1525DRAFT_389015 [Lipomyces kononenkoae]|uniref:Uncharacterized protein n=1 Tax=Lipomyces kononenkoae TaxID=34357 RepID=A0ACC3SZA6_LIPKO